VENFQERVEAQKASEADAEKNVKHYCSVCKKTFGNDKALQSHLVSNRHMEAVKEVSGKEDVEMKPEGVIVDTVESVKGEEKTVEKKRGKNFPVEEAIPLIKVSEKKVEMEVEDEEDEDWEEVEGEPIPITNCLFCEKESKDWERNLVHMSTAHSFFIPDAEYCVDVEGLLEYLGSKVGEGMMCLWCNERGRSFYTLQAAQQHMRDKGHCRMLYEGEALFEYTDFYDYSASYPEEEQGNPDEIYQPEPAQFNENMQLVLPSGVTLGHRALKIYYKQYVRPSSQLVSPQSKRNRIIQQYKAIGYGETSLALAQMKNRDQKYFKHVRDKYRMKLGISGNKTMQHHFRRQVQF
jgi:pre-60S factor REI1